MSYKLSTLEIMPKTKASVTSQVFVAEPEPNKEALAGKLFAVIEVEDTNVNALKIVNFLIENIVSNYYQDEKISLMDSVKTVKAEHVFEAAVGKTNRNLTNFLRENKLNIRSINATIGVIFKDNLHFANAGKNKVKLISKNIKDEKKYNIIDVTGHTQDIGHENKLFTSIINGAIPAGGYVVFSNEVLPEYISDNQLAEIVSTLPPQGAAEQIRNMLSGANNYVSFLGLIIKNTIGEKELPPVTATQKTDLEKSVRELNSMEEKTEKLLSAGGSINFEKVANAVKNVAYKPVFSGNKKTGYENIGTVKKGVFAAKRKINLSILKKILDILLATIILPVKAVSFIYKIITNKEKREEIIKNTRLGITDKISRIKNWFKFLSKKNKIVFAILIACVLLLSANLSWLYFRNQNMAQESNYNDLIKKIEQKQNQVDANLLYQNEESAKKTLQEIADLISQLPVDNEKNKTKYEELSKKNEEQLNRIRHAVKIENPEKIADLSLLRPDAEPENIIILNDKVYAADNAKKTIYAVDLGTSSPTTIGISQNIKNLLSPNTLKDNNIYYLSEKITKLDTNTGKINLMDMTGNLDLNSTISSASFNNSFYLLDKNNGQINRINKAGNSLSSPAPWLKNKADFSSAVDLDIDGSIYVLGKDGVVMKYFKGESKDLSMDSIEPQMEDATKIVVSEELDFMYILEPKNKRIAVYTKTGEFISQYQMNELSDLKDFTIDEANNTIYLLNASSIYKINTEHIAQ